MAKTKKEKIDGLGPDDLRNIHAAVRKAWCWSYPRRLVIKRCLGKDGFSRCEGCKRKVPKITVDHIEPVGRVGGPDYIAKMWTPSKNLRGLCLKCHGKKTREEKKRQDAPAGDW